MKGRPPKKMGKKAKAEARPFYEEGGRAIGELLNYHPEKAREIWDAVGGLGIWKQWYLKAFVSLWREENPMKYQTSKDAKYRAKKSAEARQRRLEELRPDGDPTA